MKLFDCLLLRRKDEELMIINGLKTKNYKTEKRYFLCYKKDPISFFKLFGVKSIDMHEYIYDEF